MLRSTLFILLLALSAPASAQVFNYNFVSAGYGTVDFDNFSADGDGPVLAASFAVSDTYHVFAAYRSTDLNLSRDASAWNVGVGYNTSISNTVDLVATLSYELVELNAPGPGGGVDDNGIGLGIGARVAAGENIEWNAGIKYVDLGDGGDETILGVSILYNLSNAFSVGFSGGWGDDTTLYTLSGRYYFGR
jgi:hypothetical protein